MGTSCAPGAAFVRLRLEGHSAHGAPFVRLRPEGRCAHGAPDLSSGHRDTKQLMLERKNDPAFAFII